MHANTIAKSPEQLVPPAADAGFTNTTRVDLYSGIHKALRLFMSRTMTEVGSADPGSSEDIQAALGLLERLLDVCELHFQDEDNFIHPAIERARPGSAARIAAEHQHHAEAIADLRDLAGLVADAREVTRGVALERLYRALALFVADNLQHMEYEQTAHNSVLWAHYSDVQLLAIEQELVASIPPPIMAEALHWFFPALNAANKTRRNVLANPVVQLLVIHPANGAMYRITARYLRTESDGALFERMKAKLAGIASHTGMSGVFRPSFARPGWSTAR